MKKRSNETWERKDVKLQQFLNFYIIYYSEIKGNLKRVRS